MSRPDYITDEDITRWKLKIDEEPNIPQSSVLMEVCYAGLWLVESLDELRCPGDLIVRIQYTAGKLSFGRDPWEIANQLLDLYKKDELIYEQDEVDIKSLN